MIPTGARAVPVLRFGFEERDEVNFEERLEAVTHTLELVAAMQRDSIQRMDKFDSRMDRLESQMERLESHMERFDRQMGQMQEQMQTVISSISMLTQIATSHDRRLDRLESGSQLG